jgi:Glycine-zipper domain
MYSVLRSSLGILTCCALAGCVSLPPAPSVMALPRDGVDFDQFVADDDLCRQWAERSVGIAPQQVAEQHAIAGAVIGSAVGAAAGAAIGAAVGDPGAGAAVGAGTGLLFGGSAGIARGDFEAYQAQGRYDNAYTQCMYAQGHQVPSPAGFTQSYASAPPPRRQTRAVPPPPHRLAPPPPPRGAPPPPPPGVY